jgi:N-acetylmuramic acid 6-phosphate etherase
MKAGTAQKMVLNMLSSGAMTRLGHVYGNLMVNVRPKNEKLALRAVTILERASNIPHEKAKKALQASGGSVPAALVMLQTGVSSSKAEKALESVGGNVRQAIAHAQRDSGE